MKSSLTLITIALSQLISTSVAIADLAQIQNRFGGQLSDSLTERQKDVVLRDFDRLSQMRILAARNSWFDKIFGGTSSASILNYLDERINYVFGPSASIPILAQQFSVMRDYDGEEWRRMTVHRPYSNPLIRQGATAMNLSPIYWFAQLSNAGENMAIAFNNRSIRLTSSRVGIIVLGDLYFNQDNRIASFSRMSTLIHEARHSDCKNGEGPGEATCGYLHDPCPTHMTLPNGETVRHAYADVLACDAMPWGPTAMQLVFAMEVRDHCTNCSEELKQAALMLAADGLSRNSNGIVAIDRMLQGALGEPDMSSRATPIGTSR